MEEDNAPEFKINIDGVNPDSFITEEKKEEKRNIRIERLSRKITIISILFPCIVVILLMIIYFDIKNKIAGVHDSGTIEVQNLSKNIDKKTAEFSSLYSKLEDSFEKKISLVDKMELSIKNELKYTANQIKKETNDSLSEIIKETKDNETKITNSIVQINKQLSSAQKDISDISGKMKDSGNEISSKISYINEKLNKIENDLIKYRTSLSATISDQLSSKADKKEIQQAIINEQKRFQNEMSKLESDIEQKINAIKRQLNDMEQKTIKSSSSEAFPLKQNNTSKPSVKTSPPSKTSKITEQDL